MTTQTLVRDHYPSRLHEHAEMLERRERVVHGAASDGPLTQAQLDAFDRDGMLQLPAVFDADEVRAMFAELRRMTSDDRVREHDATIIEPHGGQVRSIFDVPSFSEHIGEVIADDRVAGAARQILGSDVYLHQTRINYKPGFGGSGFDWHSDFETWHTEDGMPTPRCLSASILLTDNHSQNGPLMLMPGSQRTFITCVGETPEDNHLSSLRKQVVGIPDRTMIELLHRRHGIHTATGPAGSMILFDSNTIHGSNGNITPDPRSNVFAVFNSVENALVDPFAAATPRPEHIASRDATPLAPAH
jgi:ectoine hydroxylase